MDWPDRSPPGRSTGAESGHGPSWWDPRTRARSSGDQREEGGFQVRVKSVGFTDREPVLGTPTGLARARGTGKGGPGSGPSVSLGWPVA